MSNFYKIKQEDLIGGMPKGMSKGMPNSFFNIPVGLLFFAF